MKKLTLAMAFACSMALCACGNNNSKNQDAPGVQHERNEIMRTDSSRQDHTATSPEQNGNSKSGNIGGK